MVILGEDTFGTGTKREMDVLVVLRSFKPKEGIGAAASAAMDASLPLTTGIVVLTIWIGVTLAGIVTLWKNILKRMIGRAVLRWKDGHRSVFNPGSSFSGML